MNLANLLLPGIHWEPGRGYEGARSSIERALELEVGGFILFGGDEEGVRQLTKELRQRSRVPLLLGAELERGAGQQFAGATGLPPLAAISSLNDPDAVRRAARLTAREARTLGVNLGLSPVCDVDLEPENPAVGTRAFCGDAERAALLAATWVRACQGEGVLACAKHFPGHGRTRAHARLELPVVEASRMELVEQDLRPFRAVVEAGVAAVMTAHVAYPALDASGVPATLSREMLQWLLRQQLGFDGLIVSDSLGMRGVLGGRSEGEVAADALNAGCDLLLCPGDIEEVLSALQRARSRHELRDENVRHSLRRRLKWAQWASPPNEWRRPAAADVAWGHRLADSVVRMVRGARPPITPPLDVMVVAGEAGAEGTRPAPESFLQTLRDAGWDARRVDAGQGAGAPPAARRSSVIALFGETFDPGGSPGYSEAARAAVERAAARSPGTLLLQFGHPRLIRNLPAGPSIATAWGGDDAMQQAAARWLMSGG